MLDITIRIMSENLARTIGRRAFLRRLGEAAFAGVAALSAGQLAYARGPNHRGVRQPLPTPSCSPPGPYCNTGGGILTGCQGSACFQHLYNGEVVQCRVYYQYYQVGCWTSSGTGGYWTCCDCECLNTSGQRVATCGCGQFSGSPLPRPDTPTRA